MDNAWIYFKTNIHTQTELKTDATDQGLQGFNNPIARDSSSESTHMSESYLSVKLSGVKKLLEIPFLSEKSCRHVRLAQLWPKANEC